MEEEEEEEARRDVGWVESGRGGDRGGKGGRAAGRVRMLSGRLMMGMVSQRLNERLLAALGRRVGGMEE
jgi:hypothetical protein